MPSAGPVAIAPAHPPLLTPLLLPSNGERVLSGANSRGAWSRSPFLGDGEGTYGALHQGTAELLFRGQYAEPWPAREDRVPRGCRSWSGRARRRAGVPGRRWRECSCKKWAVPRGRLCKVNPRARVTNLGWGLRHLHGCSSVGVVQDGLLRLLVGYVGSGCGHVLIDRLPQQVGVDLLPGRPDNGDPAVAR